MGQDTAAIRRRLQLRLDEMARELGRQISPEGLPRGTKCSALEEIAGALGDESAASSSRPKSANRPRTGRRRNWANAPSAVAPPAKPPTSLGSSKQPAATWPGKNGSATARAVAGLFSLRAGPWVLIESAIASRTSRLHVIWPSFGTGGFAQAGRAAGLSARPGADRSAQRGGCGGSQAAIDGEGSRR